AVGESLETEREGRTDPAPGHLEIEREPDLATMLAERAEAPATAQRAERALDQRHVDALRVCQRIARRERGTQRAHAHVQARDQPVRAAVAYLGRVTPLETARIRLHVVDQVEHLAGRERHQRAALDMR